ncbi:hypothetical protein I316_03866 [Kwoniella heveanensis BCC8398]|uniref:Something about silencing protein 4 domain-containing protein n=1 Tax=Kwoniella heveanensis BCC8398 TaxID=1296120 RepID=A0A1B9GTF7_9TREE|nr:hypothetical protein I316_03866 [Kwoniella heveanensis BCC8398]
MSPVRPRSSTRLTRQSGNAIASAAANVNALAGASSSTRTTRARTSQAAAEHASPTSAISSELTDSECEGDESPQTTLEGEKSKAGPSISRGHVRSSGQTTSQSQIRTPARDVKGKGKATPQTPQTPAETPTQAQARTGRSLGGTSAAVTTEAGSGARSEAEAGHGTTANEAGPSRRVLPARIRRSAGGGEGMREVEEMIVDWLERWGEPTTTPPDDLPIVLTSIPLSFVQPPVEHILASQPEPPPITLTPTRKKADVQEEAKLGKEDKIEVPSWVMVRAGEDDEEEAREELEMKGRGRGRGAGLVSPVKRLRRGGIGDEPEEDTSDAYYMQLHKKYEVFERRQRIREKETLQFERYKMRSRIDLLKNMPKLTWSSVVSTILIRGSKIDWARGKERIKGKGADWLRSQLIKEGEEVMKRFDELLPPEQRKPKPQTPAQADSRRSTPSRASPSPSLTPPPVVLPARVAALRDHSTSSLAKRKRRSTIANLDGKDYRSSADSPSASTTKKAETRTSSPRVVKTYAKRLRSDVSVELDDEGEIVDAVKEEKTKVATQTRTTQTISIKPAPQPIAVAVDTIPLPGRQQSLPVVPASDKADRPLYPIFNRPIRPAPLHVNQATTPSSTTALAQRVPCLIEAASRRERSLKANGQIPPGARPAAESPRDEKTPLPSREKSRVIRKSDMVNPFGMPVPSVLESKSEFTIAEKEDFWPIIAQREDLARRQRGVQPHIPNSNGNMQTRPPLPHHLQLLSGAVKGVNGTLIQTGLETTTPSASSICFTSAPHHENKNEDGIVPQSGHDHGIQEANGALNGNHRTSDVDALTAEEVAEIEGVEAAVVL